LNKEEVEVVEEEEDEEEAEEEDKGDLNPKRPPTDDVSVDKVLVEGEGGGGASGVFSFKDSQYSASSASLDLTSMATLADLVVAVALSTPKTLSDFASPGARLFRGLNDDIVADVLLAGDPPTS
jgi:hypothetical protein